MKNAVAVLLWVVLAVAPVRASAPDLDEAQAIRNVMQKSAVDWNRGDLDAFATSYKNSPDIVFVGGTVSRGYAGMLEAYKRVYNTPEKRGTLTFSNLEVHLLGQPARAGEPQYATVVGNCHLDRPASGGGPSDCIYSLVFEKTPAGWKIILDHTSVAAKKR